MKNWEATGKNGYLITEEDINWDLVKDEVVSLSLNNNGQKITLPNNLEYVQGKTASATLGGQVKIESRFIGFIKDGVKFVIRVDEETNEIRIEL